MNCARRLRQQRYQGAIVVLAAVLMVPFPAVLGSSIDLGIANIQQAKLQNGVDAAAIAIAKLNSPHGGCVLRSSDREDGPWDTQARQFTPRASSCHAVSMAEIDPSHNGSPAANLPGERRSLVADATTYSRPNPAGGSYLPLLSIEIPDPQEIDITILSILEGQPSGGGGAVSMVQWRKALALPKRLLV